jgi:hypothetical protein
VYQSFGTWSWRAMEEDAAQLIDRFGVSVTGATGWEDEPR